MLSTLPYRCHTVTGSGDISSLYTEIIDYYDSGSIPLIFGNKLISELCKRKRVVWNNLTCGLDYLSGSPTPTEYWQWESGIDLLWESGIPMATE